MHLIKIFFTILISFALNVVAAQNSWILFENPIDNSFSVEIPSEMEMSSKEVITAVGPLETIAFTLEGKKDDKIKLFLITQVEYPSATFPADSMDLIDEFLVSSIGSAAESIGGEVVYKSKVKRLGNGAYIFRIKYNKGTGVVKGKILIHNDTLYMLQVYCHVNDSLFDDINYFLSSFRLKS